MSLSQDFNTVGEFDWSPYPTRENKKRWSAQMKRGIVVALTKGILTPEDIKSRYKDISTEEIERWVERYKKFGMKGLMASKMERIRYMREPQ